MVLKLYVLLGHHTKLTHTKFCDKICHILEVMGTNECARHYKSGFNQGLNSVKRLTEFQMSCVLANIRVPSTCMMY